MKCNVCPEGTVLDSEGCLDSSLTKSMSGSCNEGVRCKFGATCQESTTGSQCACLHDCGLSNTSSHHRGVCGSDGITYSSDCHLQKQSCRLQKKIIKLRDERCRVSVNSGEGVTPSGPVKRSTVYRSTSSGDTPLLRSSSTASEWSSYSSVEGKSTRELSLMSVSEQLTTSPTESTPSIPDSLLPIKVPSFSGDSFLELHRLQAYTRLTIELDFVSFAENGILLYNGQTHGGEGDFVSITIKSGYIEFRFNLGSGTEVLRSPQKILLGKLTKVIAKRYLRDGTLTVEGQEDVAGKSVGDLKSLDLAESLFLGSVPLAPLKVFENLGVKEGFIGCLHRLRVGSKDIDLSVPGSKDIMKSGDVIDCSENPCSGNPCMNEATCFPDKNHPQSFVCLCEEGFTGKTCNIAITSCGSDSPCIRGSTCTRLPPASNTAVIDYTGFVCLCPSGRSGIICSEVGRGNYPVANFSGSSFLRFNTLNNVAQSFVIEVWFMTRAKTGLVLFNGQKHPQGRGDYFALVINTEGFLEFTFDLGSGGNNSLTLKSSSPVKLNIWHSVRITRVRKRGSIQVDDGMIVSGETQGSLSELNLDQPFFVGGHETVKEISFAKEGLDGAVQRIVVNGDVWDDLLNHRSLEAVGVKEYQGHPCRPENPCFNEGICLPRLNDYECKCSNRFTGKKCHKPLSREEMHRAVAFDGNTFMSFSTRIRLEI